MALVRKLQRPQFEKVAIRTSLGETPAEYPSELLGQLFKQHPWLSSYDVNVQVHKQDDAAGYLYGVFVARPRAYEANPDAPSVRVPIVVAARRVFPFDVFITKDGKFFPVTETRVSNALFEASAFRAINKDTIPFMSTSPSNSLVTGGLDDSTLSNRYGQTYGNQIKVSSPLETVLGGASPEMLDAFLRRVDGSPELRASAMEVPAFARALDKIRLAEPGKVVEASAEVGTPIAAALLKTASGFQLLYATSTADGTFAPSFVKVALARKDLDGIDLRLRQEALAKGFALLDGGEPEALAEVAHDAGELSKIAEATETGVYVTMDGSNNPCRVAVVADVRGIDGRRTDLALVVGEKGAAVQEKIAGILAGPLDLTKVAGVAPTGRGVFITGNTVTEPVTVRATLLDADTGNTYIVDTDLGQRYHLKMASVLKQAQYGTRQYLFSDQARFMPLKDAPRPYVSDPVRLAKFASVREVMDSLTVQHNTLGGVDILSNTGEQLFKTASVVEAAVTLRAMGDTREGALEKLAKFAKGACSRVRVVPKRRPAVATLKKEAKALPDVSAIRIDLVKEAAALAVPDTIETVLSLNFVTPETVTAYLEHMPSLEECVSKLAELLLASRIGVQDIPEGAITSAMSGVERAIQGLKKLQIRLSLPSGEPQ
jgi:hypothetical protein